MSKITRTQIEIEKKVSIFTFLHSSEEFFYCTGIFDITGGK